MPLIKISATQSHLTREVVSGLQSETTALMAKVLNKRPEVTVVQICPVDDRLWATGGTPNASEPMAHLEAYITADTNTADEKAAFIEAAHAMLQKHLMGPVSPGYVLIKEVPAQDWGFDGRTQAARRLSAI